MEERRLEIRVIGIGEIKVIRNGSETLLDGGGFIQGGPYLMQYERVKDMVFKRLDRDYHNKSILIIPGYK